MDKIIGMTGTMILGVIFLLLGRFFLFREKKIKAKGGKTTAKIVDRKVQNRQGWKFTLEYIVDGELIRKKIIVSKYQYNFNKGDEVSIFYDENKPKKFCFENDTRYLVRAGLFFFVGGMEMLVGIIVLFQLLWKF